MLHYDLIDGMKRRARMRPYKTGRAGENVTQDIGVWYTVPGFNDRGDAEVWVRQVANGEVELSTKDWDAFVDAVKTGFDLRGRGFVDRDTKPYREEDNGNGPSDAEVNTLFARLAGEQWFIDRMKQGEKPLDIVREVWEAEKPDGADAFDALQAADFEVQIGLEKPDGYGKVKFE